MNFIPRQKLRMRHLLSSEYIPFGSQYYRAPSPRAEDWDRDLHRMADLGFNTVKYWIQWRWNHPEEDRFDFEDIDRLMDLANEHGLRVMLNTIVDVAPAWIYKAYPDASMITRDGWRIGPQSQPHRQIGGLGWCFNHTEIVDHMARFLREAVQRYKDHPALEIWNVASEPELTSSMAELRRYADDASKMGDMLCYCDRCAHTFRQWLTRKYEHIDVLNRAWNRNYASFDEAERPQTRNTFNDLIDWRMFFVDTLGANVRRRFEVAEEADEGRHPLMCHHVFIQGFPVTATANDPWNVGQTGDLHGITQMDDAMMCDVLRSCARGKPVISAEMLMLPGYTLDLPAPVAAHDIKRHVFIGLAANLKGFIFWQYRPETLGREAPTWGLTHLDGTATPTLDAFAEVGQALQEHASFVLDATPRPAEVALIYHPENQIFAWAATGSEKTATDSLLGTHRALYAHNYLLDLLHPREIDEEALARYKVIVFPFPYVVSETVAQALRRWVKAGGVLIGEAYFAGWDLESGRHHTTVPGYGLHDLFGVQQRAAEPARQQHFSIYHGVLRGTGLYAPTSLQEPVPGEGFLARQHFDPSNGLGLVEMQTSEDLPGLAAGSKVYGCLIRETFEVKDAEVVATFSDGAPAITRAAHGDGVAILIGSYVGLPFHRFGYPSNAALIAGLVASAADIERPQVLGGRVRVDVLTTENQAMVILQNLESKPVEALVTLPGLYVSVMTELFGRTPLECQSANDGSTATFLLQPKDVHAYLGDLHG